MILDELLSDKEKFFSIIRNDWLSSKDSFPEFLLETTNEMKSENEIYIKNILSDLKKQFKKSHRFYLLKKSWRARTFELLKDILNKEEVLGIHHYMSPSEIDAFINELKDFIRKVRSFSPELSFADIGQAIRNYIVFAMFKKIHKIDTGFNLAGFGYSMLYPFTDNYIDNGTLSTADKVEYNQLIHDKLEGKDVCPKTEHQKKTCELLQFIEDLYPRNRYPYIHRLLLMMLDAQETSLLQQNRELPLNLHERLNISIYKGGISVLMDRVFVDKEVSHEDLLFYLGFGFFLQLADDLQDIREDSDQGHSNLFTFNLDKAQEDRLVNRLFHYLHMITSTYQAENNHLKEFLLTNSYLLICSSVIRSREFFSMGYLDELEKYLPVSTAFLEQLLTNRIEKLDEKLQKQYMSILDDLVA